MGRVHLLSFIAFALLFFVPFLGMSLAPCDGLGCNVSDSPDLTASGTNATLALNETPLFDNSTTNDTATNGTFIAENQTGTSDESFLENETILANETLYNETLTENETILDSPETNESANDTSDIESLPASDTTLENETILENETFTNETTDIELPETNETLFNETANETSGLEIISSNETSTVLSNGNGTIEISTPAYSQLENDETLRVIATSEAPTSPDFADSNISVLGTVPSSDLTVLEINESDLSALIDTGVSNIYEDTEMEAALSDTTSIIGADLAQSQLGFTGAGTSICLLDTGVDFTEASLNGTAISGYDFVNNDADASDDSASRHGTAMAAVIHAIAPQAQIISVKVLGTNSKGFASDIIAGIDYCRQNTSAKIILMSFGGGSYTEHCDNVDLSAQAASAAAANGILAISSAGNKGTAAITAPACGENVTAVSATTKSDTVWSGSNINSMVKLLAPGADVTVLSQSRSGTSISAAHVAGAAVLLLEAVPSYSSQQAETQLISTGKLLDIDGTTYSRLDIYAAITGNATSYIYNGTTNQTNETQNYTYEAAIACPSGMVSHWKAEGDALDRLGLNNGTLYNSATYAAGISGRAFSFNSATSDYMSAVDSSSLERNDTDFTVAGWVYFDATPAGFNGVITKWTGDYAIYRVSDQLWFGVWNASADYDGPYTNASTPLSAGQWYFIVGEHDAANNRAGISLNAAPMIYIAWSGGSGPGSNPLRIGVDQVGNYMDGMVDEVAIFNRTLSTAEISQMYNAGLAGADYCGYKPTSGCGFLNTPNTFYTLNESINVSGDTCLTVNASNVTINCSGFSITGNNSTSTYGIYSTQFNTTIQNCNISNFDVGIYFNAATYGAIDSTNASSTYTESSTTGIGVLFLNAANYNRITNCSATSAGNAIRIDASHYNTVVNSSGAGDYGLVITNAGTYNNITNSTGISSTGSGDAIYIYSSSYNNVMNSTGTSAGAGHGIFLLASSNNILTNVRGISSTGYGIHIRQSSNNNNLINSLGTGSPGIYLYDSANYNNLTNSTGNSTAGNGIAISTSYNNLVNCTGTSSTGNGILIADGAASNNILNSNGTSSGAGTGIAISTSGGGANYNTITNSTGTSNSGAGIGLWYTAYDNVTNSTGISTSGVGISLGYYGTNSIIILNSTATSGSGSGMQISPAYNNNITNCRISGHDNTYGALYMGPGFDGTFGNILANSTINGNAGAYAAYLSSSTGNTFINNTFHNATTALVYLDASASGNTFYWNNFTNASGYYVQDANGANYYNATTQYATNEGNIWDNVISGSVGISGNTNSSGFPWLYIGAIGVNYPYNAANSSGRLSGNITDNAPLTTSYSACAPLSTAGTTYNLTGNATINGATCFNVTAENVTLNCDGFSITGNNTTGTYGIYSNQFNTTVRNCQISNFETGIYFNGATNGTITGNNVTVSRSDAGAPTYSSAILLYNGAGNNTVSNNNATSATLGIMLYSAPNNIVTDNIATAQSTYDGIMLLSANYNQIHRNNATGYRSGIDVYQSSYNNITNCTGTSAPGHGIYIWTSSSYNNVLKSTGTSASNYGIWLYASSYNNITNSTGTSSSNNAVYLSDGSTYNSITNSAGFSTSGTGLYLYVGCNYNNFTNFTGTSSGAGYGIGTQSASNNNIVNSTGTSSTGIGIGLIAGTYYSTVTNCTATTNSGNGMAIFWLADDNNVTNSRINGNASNGAFLIGAYARRNIAANNTINGKAGPVGVAIKYADSLSGDTTDNTLYNNTIYNATTLLYIDSLAANNTFYWNNFTNASGYYVDDDNGGNYYNATVSGHQEGNIWENVVGGSVEVVGNTSSTYLSSLYIGTHGAGYPYNTANSGGKLSGTIADNAPLTPLYDSINITAISGVPQSPNKSAGISCNVTAVDAYGATFNVTGEWHKNGTNQTALAFNATGVANNTPTLVSNLSAGNFSKGEDWSCNVRAFDSYASTGWNMSANITIQNSPPTITHQPSFSNVSVGHSFNVTAGITDLDGASDISSTNISTTEGPCVYLSNSTDGNDFNVTYNCTATSLLTTTIVIGFTDTSSAYVNTSTASNQYPDNAPTIVQPTITPDPAYVNSTLTCNNASFSDIDGDTENASSRSWIWYKNGSEMAGQANSTLTPGNFVKGDNISCRETVFANNWPVLNATNLSANLTISNSLPFIAVQPSFSNVSVGHSFNVTAGITDMDGAGDIASTNISTTEGPCVYLSNSTSGNDFNVTYNCTAASLLTTTIVIGFTDTGSAYVNTSTASNQYPDNAPTIVQPTITPASPQVNDTLTCNNASFSDIDSDTENASSRSWQWYKNGSEMAGQTNSTLTPGNFIKNDNISCRETVFANNWPALNATNLSANITIETSGPIIAYNLSFSNVSAGHSFNVSAGVTDLDGAGDIASTNISTTQGSCVYLSNSTSGNSFNVTYNCTATSLLTTTIVIGFTDTSAAYAQTSAASNQYPDNAPAIEQPAITPSPAYINDTLTCNNASFSDIDGDTENASSRSWIWYKNGSEMAGQANSTLATGNFVKNDNISCRETVFANNWPALNATNLSANLTISNSLPSIAHQPSFSNVSVGHSFNVTAGITDMDGAGDIASTNISTTAGSCAYLANSTSGNDFNVTYNCTATSLSTATIVIGFTDTSAAYVNTSTASNQYPDNAPAIEQPTITPSPAYVNDTLTCNNASFSDIDSDTENASSRAWIWYKNGTEMAGQTNSTLTPGNFLKNDNISCRETVFSNNWPVLNATNLSGNITINNSELSISYQPSFSNVSIGHSFNVSAGVTDTDGAGDIAATNISTTEGSCAYLSNSTSGNNFNVTYNCTAISTLTASIVIGFTDTSTAYINTSTASNQYPDNAPAIGQPAITPSPSYINDTLTCNNASFSDIDGDTENITSRSWIWYKNGTEMAGQANTTLASGNFVKNDNISCRETVFANNWSELNATNLSANLTISNSLPTIAHQPSFSNASVGHSFNVSAGITDMDGAGDIASTNISASAGTCAYLTNTTDGNNFNVTYNCTATSLSTASIAIGFTDTSAAYVNTSTASNQYPDNAPAIAQPTITPAPANVNSTLTCNNASFTDIDSDTENASSRSWIWYLNGAVIANQTNSTLATGFFLKNDNISCRETVFANNWPALNATNISGNTTIGSATPAVVAATFNSPVLYINDTLAGSCRAIDADNDSVMYYWSWYKNGAAFSSGSSGFFTQNTSQNLANITSTNLTSGNWTFGCIASDGASNSSQLNGTFNMPTCFALNATNQTYTMTENASASGATCFSVTAANVTLDCAGFSITGTSTGSTSGITTSQHYTTIRNCMVYNFGHGVFFSSAANGSISNATISLSSGTGNALYLLGATNITATSTAATAIGGSGLFISTGSNTNSISNSNFTSTSGHGAYIYSSTGNSLSNIRAISGSGDGMRLLSANSSTIYNATASTSSGYGIYLSSAANNTLSNVTPSSSSGTLMIVNASNNNTITRSLFNSTSQTLLAFASTSANNTFYWNNFTNTSGLYVNDLSNGTNHLNYTIGSRPEGNFWFIVLNGSADIVAAETPSQLDTDYYVGTSGQNYPFNSTNSLGKIIGAASDRAPLAPPSAPSFPAQAYFNGIPTVYFANNTTANITSTAASSSAPSVLVRDPTGAIKANATMNGTSGNYYHEYTIGGASGWYNITISRGVISFSYPAMFYSDAQWTGNFTDPSNSIFPYRVQVNVSEPGIVARAREPVEMPLNLSGTSVTESSIRLVANEPGILISIPYQLSNQSYNNSSGNLISASIHFADAFQSGQNRTYYYYYSYGAKTQPSYSTDLLLSGNETFENTFYLVNINYSRGGALDRMKSKYSGTDMLNTSKPQGAPEVNVGAIQFKASDVAASASSLENGSVFATYRVNGSLIPALMPYSMAYTFYAGTNYFTIETNLTDTIGIATEYRDANLSALSERFNSLSFSNGTIETHALTGSGTVYANITYLEWLSISQLAQKNAIAFLTIENSSSGLLSHTATAYDAESKRWFENQLFRGTGSPAAWFHSKNAYMIYDPSDTNAANATYLALANPLTHSIGSRENVVTPAPGYTSANYTPYPANDTDNVTCFSQWQTSLDLVSATIDFSSINYTSTASENLSGNSSWANATFNSSVLQAGAASCTFTVYDVIGQANSTTISFTLQDKKPPAFFGINNSVNASRATYKPNVTIFVDTNLTEFTDVDTVLLQYNSSANTTLVDVPMGRLSNGSHWFYYNASFTPAAEAYYSYRIYANDTAGNSNYSSFTNLSVFYEETWSRTPSSFGAVVVPLGENTSMANITLNATGDLNITVRLTSNFYDKTQIYYDGMAEGTGYYVNLTTGTPATVEVNATARSLEASDSITITITSNSSTAVPQANTTTGTLVSSAGGPYLEMTFTTIPAAVDPGNASVELVGRAKNLGNETATDVNITWSIPSGWSVVSGSLSDQAGNLSASGAYYDSTLIVSVPSTETPGAKTVAISSICAENKTGYVNASITVTGTTPTPTPTPSPGGGGSSGGGKAAGPTKPGKAPPATIVKNVTFEQKEQFFTTLAYYELVRGRDNTFQLNITNPLESDLLNVTVTVSGYLYQYMSISPSMIASIPPGESRTVNITISAPKYFSEGSFTLYFDIRGVSVSEGNDSITTTNVEEKRTVQLRIMEMGKDEAYSLITEAYRIGKNMSDEGVFGGPAASVLEDAEAAYGAGKYGELRANVERLRGMQESASEAKAGLLSMQEKMQGAQAEGIATPQTSRLYTMASAAFSRGDFATAMDHLKEADLTFALETAQGFSIEAFIRKYALHMIAAFAILVLVSAALFTELRFWMIDYELSQLGNEERIVLGLIKEIQGDYFEHGKMSSEEYTISLDHYEGRLSKIVQKKVELETLKQNYFRFMSREQVLRVERGRVEQLMQGLQKAYLSEGTIETRIYENRMKSYVTRMSDIEEQLAVMEADRYMRGKGTQKLPDEKPPEEKKKAELAKEGAAGAEKDSAQLKKQPEKQAKKKK